MPWVIAADAWLAGIVPGLTLVHFSAMLGILFHEGVRLYRSVWDNAPVSPLYRPFLYTASLLILGGIGISLAFLVDVKTAYQAVFVGFAVPTSIRTVMGEVGKIHTDDHFNTDAAELNRKQRTAPVVASARTAPTMREFVGSLVRP